MQPADAIAMMNQADQLINVLLVLPVAAFLLKFIRRTI